MRIAVLVGRHRQWSESFIARECASLEAHGHAIARFACESGEDRRWFDSGGRAMPAYSPVGPLFPFRIVSALLRCGILQLRRSGTARRALLCLPWMPDLIWAQFCGLPGVIGAALARGLGVPLAVTGHARDIWVPWRPGLRATRLAKHVVVCNDAARTELIRRLPEIALRCTLVRHPLFPQYPQEQATNNEQVHPAFTPAAPPSRGSQVPTEAKYEHCLPAAEIPSFKQLLFSDPMPAYAPDMDRLQLVAAGRFVAKKGFHVLLRAMRELCKEEPAARLSLIGEGPQQAWLKTLIHELGLQERVDLVSRQKQDELWRRIGRCRAVVVPSVVATDGDRDGIPNVMIEAMAIGAPVIGTDVGGLPEVLDEATGWVARSNDPAALTEQMLAAMRIPMESERRAHAALRRVREMFGHSQTTDRLEALLREALEAAFT